MARIEVRHARMDPTNTMDKVGHSGSCSPSRRRARGGDKARVSMDSRSWGSVGGTNDVWRVRLDVMKALVGVAWLKVVGACRNLAGGGFGRGRRGGFVTTQPDVEGRHKLGQNQDELVGFL